jgi:hypothetical protein
VIQKILLEFEAGKTVELAHESGGDVLMWRDGESRSISVGIPQEWLENPMLAAELEITTRNFAGHVAKLAL